MVFGLGQLDLRRVRRRLAELSRKLPLVSKTVAAKGHLEKARESKTILETPRQFKADPSVCLSVCLVVWLVVFEGTTSKEFVLVQRICYLLTYCRFLALEVEEM